jgi:hypothetical protein
MLSRMSTIKMDQVLLLLPPFTFYPPDDEVHEREGIAPPGEKAALSRVDESALVASSVCGGPSRKIKPFETTSELLYPVPYGQAEGVDPQVDSSICVVIILIQVIGKHLFFYTDSYGVNPDDIRPGIKPGDELTVIPCRPEDFETIVSAIFSLLNDCLLRAGVILNCPSLQRHFASHIRESTCSLRFQSRSKAASTVSCPASRWSQSMASLRSPWKISSNVL